MKTIEEKAKRYDEAYKVAESIHRFSSNPAEIKRMEEIFPSLKESEDERIRKEILDYIDKATGCKRWVAWLEKQGNTNIFDVPKISIKNAVEVTSRMQYIDDDIKPIAEFIMDYANWDLHKDEWNQPTLTVPLFRVLDALIQKGKPYCVCNQNIEKQGEQKSFDYENANIPQKDSTWSEEDKHWMQKVIDFMNHPDLIKATPTLAKDTINWLKSLKDRVQPQSKQEWSEEDERNLQGIIDEIEANKHSAPDYDLATYDKFLSWLKSFKPRNRWKPSDVQIEALEHFIRSIGESGHASPYENNTKLLYSLLEQLKKIREE